MALKAATIASSLKNCWQKIGRLTPQKIEDFLAQVKKQAPSNRPSLQTFVEMIVSFSKSDDVSTPSGLSSDDAFLMCDGDASDYDSVMSMLVGEEAALEYRKGLQEAGDLGGGRGDNSAEGRQREGMMVHTKMISKCGHNERYSDAMSGESKKLSRIDQDHIQGLSVEIYQAPPFVRGEHGRPDCNLSDDYETPDDALNQFIAITREAVLLITIHFIKLWVS